MKFVAAVAAAALIVVSPGLAPYEAAAQVVGVSFRVERPGSQVQAAARVPALLAPTSKFTLTSLSLGSSLPALRTVSARSAARVPAAAAVARQAPMPLAELVAQREAFELPAAAAQAMTGAQARGAGDSMMDRILGVPAPRAAAEAVRGLDPGEGRRPSLLKAGAVRSKERLVSFFRVLPDKERNRQFWVYTLGQALMNLGLAFHSTALPDLAAPAKEDADKLGVNRAVNWSAQAAASFSTGRLVDNASNGNKVFVRTFLGRAALFVGVSALFFPGYLGSGAFLAIIFAASFLQAMGVNAGSVAFSRILGEDDAHYNRANAFFHIIQEVSSIFGFLIAGSFIGIADAAFSRVLAGNALSFAVYAVLAVLVALGYRRWLRVPKDELLKARDALAKRLMGGRGKGLLRFLKKKAPGEVVAVSAARQDGRPVLLVEVAGEPAAAAGVPETFEDAAVKVIPRQSRARELIEGFRMIWKDRFLRLSLLFPTVYMIVSDALVFVALPRYIADVLGGAGAPDLGTILSGLTSKEGAFGLFMAAGSLGMLLSSLLMMRLGKSARKKAAGSELSAGEKQGRWTSILEGASMFSYAAVFLASSFLGTGLWFAVGAFLAAELFQAPATIVWAGLTQKVLQSKHPESMGKIYSAIFFYDLICAMAGVLFFGWLMAAFSTTAALGVLGALLAVAGILYIIQPFAIFRPKR